VYVHACVCASVKFKGDSTLRDLVENDQVDVRHSEWIRLHIKDLAIFSYLHPVIE